MGKIAFVFPGQGAQTPGMGRSLYETSPAAKAVFDLAGDEIRNLCFCANGDALNDTKNTQPCLFTVGLAAAAALKESGIVPQAAAGFSLGEIPALTYAGVFTFSQGLDFVRFRGEVMGEAAKKNPGEMYAVLRLSGGEVAEICREIKDAFPVNYNCPGQTVAAVSAAGAKAIVERVTAAGGKAIKLAVSGAFHSPFMDFAGEKITEYLKTVDLSAPAIPVYANATAKVYGDAKTLIAKQVNSPVYWQKTIENMVADGVDTFIETGEGRVLSGLIKKINPNVQVLNVSDADTLGGAVEELKNV